MKESFILHTDVWPMLERLSRAQRGDLLAAIMKHALGEKPGKLDDLTAMAFAFISAQMDRDEKKYQELCARRAEYGRKGGLATAKAKHEQAKASKSKQVQHDTDTDTDTDTVTDSDTDTETDTEAPGAPGLSLMTTDREELEAEFGADRLEALLKEVAEWATVTGKPVGNLPARIRQFASNQKRWGRGSAPEDKLTVDFDLLFGGKK